MTLPVGAVGKRGPVRVIGAAVAAVVVRGDHVLLPGMRTACGAETGEEEREQTGGDREVPGDTSPRDERW
jgi:hypothetical protein